MQWKKPKNTDKYYWTRHVQEKMRYYGLSEQKILGVIRNPKRIETGIAPNTVAAMTPAGNIKKSKKNTKAISAEASKEQTWSQEIWVLYQIKNQKSKNNDLKKIEKQIRKLKNEKAQQLMKLINRKINIISAWRYPGVSLQNNPIPEDIMREIEELVFK